LRPATQFREVTAAEALELAASGWRILDVREQVEWNEGHIPTATLVPLGEIPSRIAEVAPDHDAPLLVHCAVGARSLRASAWLVQNGYTNVVSMRASLVDWRRLGGAWEAPEQLLTPAQQRRYSRLAAESRRRRNGQPRGRALLGAPARELWRRYVHLQGYRDGPLGLVLSLALAYFEWETVRLARAQPRQQAPDR